MEGKDLTRGNLLKNMFSFLIPLFFANLLNSIYNIADGIWIGKLIGDTGLSATTNCWPIILIAYSFVDGIAVATSILISHNYTKKNNNEIKQIITPLYAISIILSIIVVLLLILTENLFFILFNTPKEVLKDAKDYINICLIGFIFNIVGTTMTSGIRAIGNSKIPLRILAITEMLNIILDPILIKMGLGIKGAAFATAISMFLFLIISFIYVSKSNLLKFNKKYLIIKMSFIKKIASLGTPMIVQEITTLFTIFFEIRLSNLLGIIGGSTYGIVSKFQSIVWILGTSICELITIVVGQFVGKNKYNKIKEVLKNGIIISILPIILIALFITFFAETYSKIFSSNQEVISTSVLYLHFAGIGYTFVPLCQLLYGFVLGLGNTKFSFITSIIATLTEFAVAIYLYRLINNVFISLGIGISMWFIVEIIIFSIYYFSNKWKVNNIKQESSNL